MTGIKMADQPRPSDKRRHALRNVLLQTGGFAALVGAAATFLNQSPRNEPPTYAPAVGLMIVIIGALCLTAPTIRYLKRTDEHDLMANLWGVTFGHIFLLAAAPAWWLLQHSGVLGPISFWALYFISALVTLAGWAWYRFR